MEDSVPFVIDVTHDELLSGEVYFRLISRIGGALQARGYTLDFSSFETEILAARTGNKKGRKKKSRINGVIRGIIVVGGIIGGGAGAKVGEDILDIIKDAVRGSHPEQPAPKSPRSGSTGKTKSPKTHVDITTDGGVHIEVDVTDEGTQVTITP